MPKTESVKNTTIADDQFEQDIEFLNSKASRFKSTYGMYPESMDQRKNYILSESGGDIPTNPLSEEYIYNPKKGKVN